MISFPSSLIRKGTNEFWSFYICKVSRPVKILWEVEPLVVCTGVLWNEIRAGKGVSELDSTIVVEWTLFRHGKVFNHHVCLSTFDVYVIRIVESFVLESIHEAAFSHLHGLLSFCQLIQVFY